MSEFETKTDGAHVEGDESQTSCQGPRQMLKSLLKRFVLFVSFGPGVLGFLWLIGRILRRWR